MSAPHLGSSPDELLLVPEPDLPAPHPRPWCVTDVAWGCRFEVSPAAYLPNAWLFTEDLTVLAPSMGWPDWTPEVPAMQIDEMVDALAGDPADEDVWEDYAIELADRRDPFAPLVRAGLAGEDLSGFFATRSARGQLLGDLPRLGSVVGVAWQDGLRVALDGSTPPLLTSGVPTPTIFTGLDLEIRHFNPAWMRGLKVIPEIRNLRIHTADLSPLDLDRIPFLEDLRGLTLDGIAVTDLTPLEACLDLARIHLHRWWGTTDLSPLAHLPALETVVLTDCPSIANLSAISPLVQIRALEIRGTPEVTDLAPLVPLAGLTALTLDQMDGVTDLEPLAELIELVELTLGFTGATDLDPVGTLQELRTLVLERCHGIEDLSGLAECAELRSLSLRGCLGVTKLPRFGRRLSRLVVSRCRHLGMLKGAAGLRHLTVFGCPRMTNPRCVTVHRSLETLSIGLVGLTDLGDLRSLVSLQTVTVLDPDPHPGIVASIEAAEPWSVDRDEAGHLVAHFDPRTPPPDPGPARIVHDEIEAAIGLPDPPEPLSSPPS